VEFNYLFAVSLPDALFTQINGIYTCICTTMHTYKQHAFFFILSATEVFLAHTGAIQIRLLLLLLLLH